MLMTGEAGASVLGACARAVGATGPSETNGAATGGREADSDDRNGTDSERSGA